MAQHWDISLGINLVPGINSERGRCRSKDKQPVVGCEEWCTIEMA
jgi:hypothetical protein